MPLPKQLFHDLHHTIRASFTRDELRVVLHLGLGESLDDLVADKAFGQQVYDLIAWAERTGKTLALLDCLCAQRPELQTLMNLRPAVAAALAPSFASDPQAPPIHAHGGTEAARVADAAPDSHAYESADSNEPASDMLGAPGTGENRSAVDSHEQRSTFLARLALMLQERGFTPAEKALLSRTYAEAIRELDDQHPSAPLIDGVNSMSAESTAPIRLTPRLLRKTAKTVAAHTAAVASQKQEWPEVLIGDEVIVQSVAHLRTLQQEVRHTAGLVERHLPPNHQRRHRRERDGLLNSAASLAGLFQELPLRMDVEYQRRQTLAELERQVDDLLYYTSRYIVWLDMIADDQAQS